MKTIWSAFLFSELDHPASYLLLHSSGHSATSIGLLAYLLLELLVYHPNLIYGLACQRNGQLNAYTYKSGYGWQIRQRDGTTVPGIAGDSVAIDVNDVGFSERDASRYGAELTASSRPLLDKNGVSCTQYFTPTVPP